MFLHNRTILSVATRPSENQRASFDTPLQLAVMEMYSQIWTAKARLLTGWYEHLSEKDYWLKYLAAGHEGQWRVTMGHMIAKTAKINKSLLVIRKEMLYFYICHIVSYISIVIIVGRLN